MKVDLTKKRVFMLCGHAQSGKTSLAEALLFSTHAVKSLGTIVDGTTVSDHDLQARARKSSVNLSVLRTSYNDNLLQFIDTPGYLDFIGEMITAAHAVDFAVIVVDAVAGVTAGTQKAWEITQAQNIPVLFVINKLDLPGVDFDKIVEEIKVNFTKHLVVFGSWEDNHAVNALKRPGSALYGKIVEAAAETNDKLLEEYVATGVLKEDELHNAIKNAIDNDILFPVVGVSALNPESTNVILDTIVDIMPSCAEALPRKAKKDNSDFIITPSIEGPFIAQVFKTVADPFLGKISIFRVYSGKSAAHATVNNVNRACKEKLSHIVLLQGKEQSEADGVCAGDIAAVVKLKETQTLDILTDSENDIVLPELNFPVTSYSASVAPKAKNDEDKVFDSLHKLAGEDLTFHVSRDPQTNEMIVSGLGELHIKTVVERIRDRYHVEIGLGTPKVPYKETLTRKVKVQGKHKKQSGGHGQYGDCWIEAEPLPAGSGFEFVNNIVGGAIPKNFIPSVEKGVRKAMEQGVLAGYPVADVRVCLVDGSYHDVDSSDIAFQIAGMIAMKKALEDGASVLLEPVMNVEISVPEELMGAVTGDVNSRRGKIMGMDMQGKSEVIKAQIPMSEMFKYVSDLRSATGGRGSFIMSFGHYAPVLLRLAQEIIAKTAKADNTAANQH